MAAASKNALLNQAKEAKKNEFYTRRQDIEAELQYYQPYFENKVDIVVTNPPLLII